MKVLDQPIMSTTVANQTKVSDSTDMRNLLGAAIEIVYTGSSLAGTAGLEYSMDNITFRALPNSGDTAQHTLTAGGGTNAWNVTNYFYPYIRLTVTSSDADVATVTARIFAKGV